MRVKQNAAVFVLNIFLFTVLNGGARAVDMLWEFGEDKLNDSILKIFSGDIGALEKTKEIALSVPPCSAINYVRVAIDNKISTPYVSYSKYTQSVIISYSWVQFSISSYNIVVKGSLIPGCNAQGGQNTEPYVVYNQIPDPYNPVHQYYQGGDSNIPNESGQPEQPEPIG